MTAANYNLTIDQGSDFAMSFTVSEEGTVKDLSGWSARAQLRPSKSSSILSAAFTCTIDNPTGGVVVMELANSLTASLTAGLYFYDLEIYTSNDVNVTRLLEGQVTITQEVTR